jgi:PAS domain S-box-containing protein
MAVIIRTVVSVSRLKNHVAGQKEIRTVNSLRENHPGEIAPGENNACWEHFNCFNVLCQAHGKQDMECWLVPMTHCTNYLTDDFFVKLTTCLSCSYFKKRGESDPKGWNAFLSDQLRKYHRKAIQSAYRKEESFVEILDRIPDGLFTTDRDWRINYFNPAAEKITGFSAKDAIGMFCKDVFKNSMCEADCALQRVIADGADVHNREFEITDIEGRKIPVICSSSAFRNSRGEVTGGLEIFKDITEHKRLQEEIVKREKKYRRIFEGSHDMIYTSTLEGDLLDVNQAGVDMLGFPNKDELLKIGRAIRLYKNPSDREKFIELIDRDGYVKDFEVDFCRFDGSPIHTLVSSRRYENPETGAVEYEGIIKDITRRKQAEKIIQLRNRELSILNSIAVVLNFTMDLDHILKVTLERVRKILSVRKGGIFLFDDEGNTSTLRAGFGLPEATEGNPAQIEFKDTMLMEYLVHKKTELEPEASFPAF